MWPSLQETADLVTFTEEILKGKLHFLCSEFFLTRCFGDTHRLTNKKSNLFVYILVVNWKFFQLTQA